MFFALAPLLHVPARMEGNSARDAGHYAALGVGTEASSKAIELAFADWREQFVAGRAAPDSFHRAERAYHVLADADARARHDRQLGLRTHPAWMAGGERTARALSRRAIAHLAAGRPGSARTLLERAAQLAPADPLVRSYLGVALARSRGCLHAAARHGEYAVSRRPKEPAFLFNLAEVYSVAGLRARSVKARALAWRATALSLIARPRSKV